MAENTNPETRKRGRPRKIQPDTNGDSGAIAPKRGRGRPRKDATAAAAATTATPKRGRGRPRKNPAGTPASKTVKSAARRRGRPAKNPAMTGRVAASRPDPRENSSKRPMVAPPREKEESSSYTTAEMNRIRLRELRGALDSELDELTRLLPQLVAELQEEFVDRIESIRAISTKKAGAVSNHDDPSALTLSSTLGKVASRLSKFRQKAEPGLDDLVELARRLEKTARKLRRL